MTCLMDCTTLASAECLLEMPYEQMLSKSVHRLGQYANCIFHSPNIATGNVLGFRLVNPPDFGFQKRRKSHSNLSACRISDNLTLKKIGAPHADIYVGVFDVRIINDAG